VPVLLYNVPPLINDIEPATVARLAGHERILGMKDSAQLIHLQDVVFRTHDRNFRVLAGLEYHVVAALLVGAHGSTPSPANLIPKAYVDLFDATTSGDLPRAFALQESVNRFSDRLDEIPSWPSAVKGALSLMGICGPTVASPLPALTTEETDLVRAHLAQSGLLS
jgi:4-hydroxy-tetrahydrodipicolinate synthase